jgi:hypothetical protein
MERGMGQEGEWCQEGNGVRYSFQDWEKETVPDTNLPFIG